MELKKNLKVLGITNILILTFTLLSFANSNASSTFKEGNETKISQQTSKVSGTVTDEGGMAIPGATVVVKGTSVGTITGVDGTYSVDLPAGGDILVFSFVGMKTQEIEIAGKSIINVEMETANIGLDEVIAIGYGTIRKSDLTGSVSTVNADDFGDRGGTGIGGLLQGRVVGVDLLKVKSEFVV